MTSTEPKRSLWERDPAARSPEPSSYPTQPQETYQQQSEFPAHQTKDYYAGQQQGGNGQGQAQYQGQPQPQVVYVQGQQKNRNNQGEDVAVGFCAGCAAACCCCGCTVM
jgi:hypothetical protein